MVYLTNSQNQYESVYGPEIWKANAEGVTLEQNIKDTALARIANTARCRLALFLLFHPFSFSFFLSQSTSSYKIMVQTFGDFKRGRRTTEERLCRNNIIPTLKDAVPGDLSFIVKSRGIQYQLGFIQVFIQG